MRRILVCMHMIIAMMVAHLFAASVATALPARVEASFMFLGFIGDERIVGSSSFSGLGNLNFFDVPTFDISTRQFVGIFRRASVSFDITDGDIHAAGAFAFICPEFPCHPGGASFQYEDPIITTGFLSLATGVMVDPDSTSASFRAIFFGGGAGGFHLNEGTVSGRATLIPEPPPLLLLGSGLVGFGLARWRKQNVGRRESRKHDRTLL